MNKIALFEPEKYSVLKTTVTNRQNRTNQILEESSEIIASFPTLEEAKAFADGLDLPFWGTDIDVYKEIMREA